MGLNGFEVTKASDITSKLIQYRKHYNDKGKYLGWDKFDAHYSMQLGGVTDWTGFPMSGKTQVLMELLLNTSEWYGWRHLIYFPDVGNNVEIIADLIHKKTGLSFNPKAKNAIDDAEIIKAIDWITHHFLVLTKKEIKAKMSPFDFYDYAVKIKKEEEIHTASVDSWKDLSHPYNEYGGYAQYLEVVLPYRNQIAEDNDLHIHNIIHPKLTEKEKGVRKAPTPYDLKGGSEWFNSGKSMITVHRSDLTSNRVEIHFNKIKPRSIGQIGEIELYYDVDKSKYYDLECPMPNSFIHHYASPMGSEVKSQVNFEPTLNRFANEDLFNNTSSQQEEVDEFNNIDNNDCPF